MSDAAIACALAASIALGYVVYGRRMRRSESPRKGGMDGVNNGANVKPWQRLQSAQAAHPNEQRAHNLSSQLLGYGGEGMSGTITSDGMADVAREISELAPTADKLFDYGMGTGTAIMRLCRKLPNIARAFGVEVARPPAVCAMSVLSNVPTLVTSEVVVGTGPECLNAYDNAEYDFTNGVFFTFCAAIPPDAIDGAIDFATSRFRLAVFIDRPKEVRELEGIMPVAHITHIAPKKLKMSGSSNEKFQALYVWR